MFKSKVSVPVNSQLLRIPRRVLSSTVMIILLYHSMNIQQYCKYQKSGSASTLGVVTFCWGGKANSYINNLPSLWTASRYLLNVQLQCFWKKSCPATPLLTSVRKQNLMVHQWWLFGLEVFEMENNISIDRAEISFATVNLENCFVFAKLLNLLYGDYFVKIFLISGEKVQGVNESFFCSVLVKKSLINDFGSPSYVWDDLIKHAVVSISCYHGCSGNLLCKIYINCWWFFCDLVKLQNLA